MLNDMHLFMQNHFFAKFIPGTLSLSQDNLIFFHDEDNDIAGIRIQGLALQLVSYYSMAIDD